MVQDNIIISNSIEYHSVSPSEIVYVNCEGNYCSFNLANGIILGMIPIPLYQVAKQLSDKSDSCFVKVGRSIIVNVNHIQSVYISRKLIIFDILNNGSISRMSLQVSQELITKLHHLLLELHSGDYVGMKETVLQESNFETSDDEVVLL